MGTGKLILRSSPEEQPPSLAETRDLLSGIGLLGPSYLDHQARYFAGPRFLQLISFLGCSPYLRLEPQAEGDQAFCHIRLVGPLAEPRFCSGSNTRPPRCPSCGRPIHHWRELEQAWTSGNTERTTTCQICGHSAPPSRLNWRRTAGIGRFLIEISEIFPGEALPVAQLMECLRGDGCGWDYFYLQQATHQSR